MPKALPLCPDSIPNAKILILLQTPRSLQAGAAARHGAFSQELRPQQSAGSWRRASNATTLHMQLNSAQPGGPGPVPSLLQALTRVKSIAKTVADSRNRGVRVGRSLGASEEHEVGPFPSSLPGCRLVSRRYSSTCKPMRVTSLLANQPLPQLDRVPPVLP